jgi:type I restriction enzyme S subunit
VSSRRPNSWAEATLEDACGPDAPIIYGILQPGPDTIGGVPYVRPTEIEEDGIDLDAIRRTTPEIAARYARSTLKSGDLLLSIVGTIGKVATVPPELEGGNITQSSCRIRADERVVSGPYIKWFLKSPNATAQYDSHRLGTAVPRLNLADVREMRVPVPPLLEQRRIVAKLDRLSARSRVARDHLARTAKLAARAKQAILAAAFRGELTLDWRAQRSHAPVAASPDQIDARARNLDPLPTGWAWTAFSESGIVSGGLTKNPKRAAMEDRAPYLRVANVYANELRLGDVAMIGCTQAEIDQTTLVAGDLLVVEGNGSLVQIGRVALWRGDIEGCLHQNHIIRVRPRANLLPEFGLFWLLSPSGRAAIEAVASSSSGLHTLSISKVKGLPIPAVTLSEQREIVRRIEAAFARIDRMTAEAARAAHLLDRLDERLLAKAFRGELVPQDPADEPAEALLARIRAARAEAPVRRRGRART